MELKFSLPLELFQSSQVFALEHHAQGANRKQVPAVGLGPGLGSGIPSAAGDNASR